MAKTPKTENGSGFQSDMDMAMAMTINSDMNREIESVTENHLGKKEAESKQASRNEEGNNECRKEGKR